MRVSLPALVAALLLLPQALSSRDSAAFLHLGPAEIESGDEPHYLLILSSLLEDGDFDLANNYAAVHRGSAQAGQRFAGSSMDHHTSWFEGDTRVRWSDVYENTWTRSSSGAWTAALRPDMQPYDGPEISLHSIGHALVLAPFLYLFRGTRWVEPIALFMSGLAVVIAMLMFRMLLEGLVTDRRMLDLVTVLTFLGTPIWHYGRSLFVEPFLLMFAVSAYALALRRDRAWIPGLLIGLGVLMKPVFVLIGLPLLLRRRWVTGVPIAVAVLLVLITNHLLLGAWDRTAQPWISGDFVRGFFGLLLSPEHGLFAFAPIAVIALPGLFLFDAEERLLFLAPFVAYVLVHALWFDWGGGWSYGPRFLVPVIPFVMIGLVRLRDLVSTRHIWSKGDVVILGLASLAINALGALPYWRSWGRHPFFS